MKKLFFLLCLIFSFSLYAQTADEDIKASKGGISEIPAAKRPKAIDKEKEENAIYHKYNFLVIKYDEVNKIPQILSDATTISK